MKRRLNVVAAVLLVAACACGRSGSSTTGKPQGAAKLWLQAAIGNDDARLVELSSSDFRDRAAGYASQIREKFTRMEEVRWGGSGKEGSEYAWTATAPGGAVFFKVREVSPDEFRVTDVQPSW